MKNIPEKENSKKADEIFQTVKKITDLILDDNEFLKENKSHILENIMMLRTKLYSAEQEKLWDIKMENAAIIRKNARELMISYHSLRMLFFEDAKYYLMVRTQLEEFRNLFREWFITFKTKHFIVDKWGLFNPPGIDQDYQQRDNKLNFLDDDDF